MPEFPSIPDDAALAALRRRGVTLAPSDHWTDLWQEAHHRAFTVARSAGFDILGDIYGALERAMREGRTFAQFRADLEPVLRRKGWWGRETRVDPVTGRKQSVELGSPRRLRLLFDVNLRVSAAQGDWERHQITKATRPWLRYTALLDARTRPEHAAWHGVILPVDHPWWKRHYPPNGWKCRCKAMSVGPDDLEAEGWKVAEEPPEGEDVPWVHPRTGEMRRVPRGIDPGWDYNPGNTDAAAHAAKLAMDKLAFLPPRVGASAVASLAFAFPQVERELAAWMEGVADAAGRGDFRPTGARRVVGCLDDAVLAFLEGMGSAPASAAVTIGDADLLHALRSSKVEPLPVAVWARLPSLLATPAGIYWDIQNPGLVYVLDEPEGKGKMIVLVDYRAKIGREKILTNTVRTGKLIGNFEEFTNKGKYVRIK